MSETKIILISRKWPQAIMQKYRQKLYLLYARAIGKLPIKNSNKK
ncbi:hypothetical protein [Pelotomaculum terephthalicicum]|nr:hypothetical protein [Pelotomaculum terephthalicicum]